MYRFMAASRTRNHCQRMVLLPIVIAIARISVFLLITIVKADEGNYLTCSRLYFRKKL